MVPVRDVAPLRTDVALGRGGPDRWEPLRVDVVSDAVVVVAVRVVVAVVASDRVWPVLTDSPERVPVPDFDSDSESERVVSLPLPVRADDAALPPYPAGTYVDGSCVESTLLELSLPLLVLLVRDDTPLRSRLVPLPVLLDPALLLLPVRLPLCLLASGLLLTGCRPLLRDGSDADEGAAESGLLRLEGVPLPAASAARGRPCAEATDRDLPPDRDVAVVPVTPVERDLAPGDDDDEVDAPSFPVLVLRADGAVAPRGALGCDADVVGTLEVRCAGDASLAVVEGDAAPAYRGSGLRRCTGEVGVSTLSSDDPLSTSDGSSACGAATGVDWRRRELI